MLCIRNVLTFSVLCESGVKTVLQALRPPTVTLFLTQPWASGFCPGAPVEMPALPPCLTVFHLHIHFSGPLLLPFVCILCLSQIFSTSHSPISGPQTPTEGDTVSCLHLRQLMFTAWYLHSDKWSTFSASLQVRGRCQLSHLQGHLAQSSPLVQLQIVSKRNVCQIGSRMVKFPDPKLHTPSPEPVSTTDPPRQKDRQ